MTTTQVRHFFEDWLRPYLDFEMKVKTHFLYIPPRGMAVSGIYFDQTTISKTMCRLQPCTCVLDEDEGLALSYGQRIRRPGSVDEYWDLAVEKDCRAASEILLTTSIPEIVRRQDPAYLVGVIRRETPELGKGSGHQEEDEGLVLVEMGRLTEARDAFERALTKARRDWEKRRLPWLAEKIGRIERYVAALQANELSFESLRPTRDRHLAALKLASG